MIIYALFLPFFLSLFISRNQDPGPGLLTTKQEASQFDCRASTPEANLREKNMSDNGAPRGTYINEAAFRCTSKFFSDGERDTRAHAILENLDNNITRILNLAKQRSPKPPKWATYVQAQDHELNSKIKFAIEVQLAALSESVNTELPKLGADRILALSNLEVDNSLEQFCKDLPSDTVGWLGVGQIHAKSTQLQGGLCYQGVWTWLL